MKVSEQGPCPFCIKTGKIKILSMNEKGYLIQAMHNGSPLKDAYLVIPKQHTTSLFELPMDWFEIVVRLLATIPGFKAGKTDYNICVNQGTEAGQTIAHVHFWIVLRDNEEGLPSHEKGFYALRREYNMAVTATHV